MRVNVKVDDSIDGILRYFIKWVEQKINVIPKTGLEDSTKNNEIGIIFEYKGVISRVKRYNEKGYFNCDISSNSRIHSEDINSLYERFKNVVDEMITK